MGLYNTDGQIRLTAVNGNTLVGRYVPDGSWNIVINNGSSLTGINHPSGAINAVVTTDPYDGYYAPNGSMHVIAKGSSYVPLYPIGNGVPPDPLTYYIYGF